MTDETEVTPPAEEPSLIETVRAEMEANRGDEEGATPAAETAVTPEAAIAEAAPSMTPEQVTALAANPDVVTAVLGGELGQKSLETLFQEMMQGHDEAIKSQEAQKAEAATIEEALKAGQEDGDWNSFGKIMADKIAEQKAAQDQQEAYGAIQGEAMKTVIGQLDSAVEKVYGDVLDTMTEEELGALSRDHFASDEDFMAGVLGAFDAKRQELVRSATGTEVGAQLTSTAAETAAAAVKARSMVGVGALPGGSSDESIGDDVSLLLRQGIGDAFSDESD